MGPLPKRVWSTQQCENNALLRAFLYERKLLWWWQQTRGMMLSNCLFRWRWQTEYIVVWKSNKSGKTSERRHVSSVPSTPFGLPRCHVARIGIVARNDCSLNAICNECILNGDRCQVLWSSCSDDSTGMQPQGSRSASNRSYQTCDIIPLAIHKTHVPSHPHWTLPTRTQERRTKARLRLLYTSTPIK